MINVIVVVILKLKNVVVGMDKPQGIQGWPPFHISLVALFSSDHVRI